MHRVVAGTLARGGGLGLSYLKSQDGVVAWWTLIVVLPNCSIELIGKVPPMAVDQLHPFDQS